MSREVIFSRITIYYLVPYEIEFGNVENILLSFLI